MQQTVVLEYKQQILNKEADGERDVVMTELKTTLKNASVEEVFCAPWIITRRYIPFSVHILPLSLSSFTSIWCSKNNLRMMNILDLNLLWKIQKRH